MRASSFRIRILIGFSFLALAAVACNYPFGGTEPTAEVPTPTQELYTEPAPLYPSVTPPQADEPVPTLTQAVPSNPRFDFQGVSFDLIPAVYSAAAGTVTPVEKGEDGMTGWMGPSPENIRVALQGYALPQAWIEPQMLVYPIQDYAVINAPAGEMAGRLDAVMRAVEIKEDSMPFLPFWNAGQVFYSRPEIKPFQNGRGVRYLTCYAQALVKIDTACLFYTFQGLTSDGKYYVSAIFPVGLAALNTPELQARFDEVMSDPGKYEAYLTEINQVLASANPDAFTPKLSDLDALAASLSVSPTVTLQSPPKSSFSCPGALATRLTPSSRARVTFTDGTPLRVRETPGKSGKVLKMIAEGTEMFLQEGPKCLDNGVWWRMQTNTGDVSGWVMEGEGGVYFIEPWQ